MRAAIPVVTATFLHEHGVPVSLPYVAAIRAQNPDAGFGLLVARGSRVGDTVAAADAGRAVGYDVIAVDRYD